MNERSLGDDGSGMVDVAVLQVRHFADAVREAGFEAGLEASLRVMRAGALGELPLFAATLGLPAEAFGRLLRPEYRNLLAGLPDTLLEQWLPPHFDTLVALLWEYRRDDLPAIHCFARAMAAASFGERHLWQDMGFGRREALSGLVAQCFPRLHALNKADLKWKRLLFGLLGERIGLPGLLPPACPQCASFRACFPEPLAAC